MYYKKGSCSIVYEEGGEVMALKNLLKAVKSVKQDVVFEDSFLKEYADTVMGMDEPQPVPVDYYRPSSLGDGCKRMLYYIRMKLGENDDKKDSVLLEICQNGTNRHEDIQNIIANMPNVTVLDVEEVVKEAKSRGINSRFVKWNEDRTEARCVNEDLQIYFQADGVLKYKGKEVILEIKTIHQFGFDKLTKPLDKHIRQATCYAYGLGINYVLFFYEDRNFMKKKAFLYEITEEDIKYMFDKVADVERSIAMKTPPPKEEDKCLYCIKKDYCRFDGEA